MECKINMLFIVPMICTIFHRPFVFTRPYTTPMWMPYSDVSGVAKVREFGHIINLCVYRHYDIGHTACICGSNTWIYIQQGADVCVCVVFFTHTLPLSTAWSSSFVDFQMRTASADNMFRFRSMYRKHLFDIHIPHCKSCSSCTCTTNVAERKTSNDDFAMRVKMSWHLCKYRRRPS